MWQDSRHPMEREADARIAAERSGGAAVAEIAAVTSSEAIEGAADRLVAARVLSAVAREGRVSKLGAIADRIAEKKKAHDAKADEWALRLDALDRREPDAFAIGDAVIAEREGDLSDMERTMRSLGNLPNVVSGGS